MVDENHSIFELENKEKVYVGYRNLLSEKSIGKNFNLNLIERFNANYIKVNPSGNYKFICNEKSIPNKKNLNYFKDLINNKMIEITTEFNINNLQYGNNYDLNLYKEYKGLNWKYDIVENQQPNLTKIVLLNKKDDNVFDCKTENGNIIIRVQKRFEISNSLIGKSILVEKYPKFLAEVYTDTLNPINLDFILNETPIINNLDISLKKKIINIYNNNFLLLTKITLNNTNLDKKLNSNFFKVYITNNYHLNKNGNYKLIQILNCYDNNVYFFNHTDYTVALLIANNPNLRDYIGETFNLNINKLTLVQEIKENENGKFRFLSIKDNKYIFRDIENNSTIVCLLQNSKTPSESNVGKKFNLKYIDTLFSENINDVN